MGKAIVLQSLIVMCDNVYAANILILSDTGFDKGVKHDLKNSLCIEQFSKQTILLPLKVVDVFTERRIVCNIKNYLDKSLFLISNPGA